MSKYDLLWAEARKLPADASDEVLRAYAQAISDARAEAESPSIAPTFSRKAILFNQELEALKIDLANKSHDAFVSPAVAEYDLEG